jgi:hypothetical protein
MPITSGINANVFRAVSGSLFSTAANWSRGIVPTDSDVADIRDNCIIDINRTIRSLVVQPGFTASINTGLTLNISQSINVLGHLSCSGTPTINILGQKNNINSLSPASSSFFYLGSTQTIPGVTYWTLSIRNPGVKTSNGTNTTVLNLLNVREYATYNIFNSNLTVNGTSRIGENQVNGGALLKTGTSGNVLFIGTADFNNGSSVFSGNPRVEIRNGFTITNLNNSVSFGDNDLYFTTNNQSIYEGSNFFSFSTELSNNMFISGGIRLTLDYLTTTLKINRPINGLSANDVLINKGRLYFNTANSVNTMVTGGFDYSTFNNFIGYTGNYSANMLPYSSSYRNLYITGTGVKTLPRNTSVSGTLSLDSQGTLDMGNFDLIVSGTANIGANAISPGYLQKSTPGNIIFIGRPYFFFGFITLTNNPTVEFRNGIDANYTNVTLNSNNIRFTTNNQTILSSWSFPSVASSMIFSGSALISGGINLNLTNHNYFFDGPINGFSASDTLVNSGSIFFISAAAFTGSLLTGSSNFSFPGNTVAFSGNYSGTSSPRLNTFFNLSVSGTGIKTLGTSSYVSGSLTFGNPATFELSSSNLFVNGTTNTGNGVVITRSGSGTTVFNGRVTQLDFGRIDFRQGNASVEFRNGVDSRFQAFVFLGSGSAIFSTNDQSYLGYIVNTGDIIISGSIRLRNQSQLDINKAINGTVPSSILDNSGSIYFTSPAACNNSMLTGSFISASFPGSVLGFAFTGSYKIPFSSFRNLTLNPGGIVTSPENKTLSRDTIIFENLSITRDRIDTENNNVSVLGACLFNNGGIKKSGSGSILLSGSVDLLDSGIIDFTSASNASLEMRGGIIRGTFGTSILMGTSSVTYSINNQNIVACNVNNQYGSILISGPITVGFGLQAGIFSISGSLNGTDVNSRFFLSASSTAVYYSPQTPMQTGILDVSASAVTFTYISGSQNVKGGIYRNLTMLSGTKTLQGNVSVLGTLNTGSGATLATVNLNGFTLTNP